MMENLFQMGGIAGSMLTVFAIFAKAAWRKIEKMNDDKDMALNETLKKFGSDIDKNNAETKEELKTIMTEFKSLSDSVTTIEKNLVAQVGDNKVDNERQNARIDVLEEKYRNLEKLVDDHSGILEKRKR